MKESYFITKIYELNNSEISSIIHDKLCNLIVTLEMQFQISSFHWLSGHEKDNEALIHFHLKLKESDIPKVKDVIKNHFSNYKLEFSNDLEEKGDSETLGPACKDLLGEFLYPACKLAVETKKPENKDYLQKGLNKEKFVHCFLNSQGLSYQEEISFHRNQAIGYYNMLYPKKTN